MSSHLTHVLAELVIVIGAAALAALVFHALRLPVVLGYILAGLLIGPHVAPSLVADTGLVHTLSDLGIILLFFTIGLEFSVRTIARVGFATLVTVVVELSMTALIMFGIGRALGFTGVEALFLALGVIIASTMLVVKGLEETGVSGPAVQLILAMMVVEDLLSILLLAIVTGIASGAGMSASELAGLIGKMLGFLVAIVAAGMLVIPRLVRLVVARGRSELVLITAFAICFAMVWAADASGFSIALGAFAAGMLIAESGKAHDVDVLVRPFRDLFAAIFFVSIGMTIDPRLVASNWLPVVIVAVVLVVAKSFAVSLAAFLTGNGLRPAVQAGLALSQIGEISFIVAAIGIAGGVSRDFLLPVVVGASCITAISGAWQVRGGERAGRWIAEHLPRRIATFVTFYDAWLSRLRSTPRPDTLWRRLRLPMIVLVVDAALLSAVVIGAALVQPRLVPWIGEAIGLTRGPALGVLIAGAAVVGAIFALGIVRQVVRLAHLLAAEIFPARDTAPRRVLILMLELLIALTIGLPLALVTWPFVPGGGIVVLGAVVLLLVATQRSIASFDSHVRAGSELIVEVLARQGRETELAEVEAVLPGFAGLTPITLTPEAAAVGKSLADLDLRARSGASVLAIKRDGGGNANPSPREPLRAGDVLALAGSADAIAEARAILLGAKPKGPAESQRISVP